MTGNFILYVKEPYKAQISPNTIYQLNLLEKRNNNLLTLKKYFTIES